MAGLQSFAELEQRLAAEAEVRPVEPELPPELLSRTEPGLLHTFAHHETAVRDVAVSRGGKFLATGSLDKTCAIIRLKDLSEVQRLKVEGTGFEAVEFSVDGKHLFTGLGNNVLEERNLWIWDWEKGQKVADLLARQIATLRVSLSPNGRYLVSTYRTGLIDVRRMDAPNNVNYLGGHDRSQPCWDAAFSPDSRSVATAGGDGMVYVWAVDPAQQSRMNVHDAPVRTICFSPDGKYVLTGSSDKTLRLWKDWGIPDRWMVERTFEAHEAEVTCAAYFADGRRIVSGGADNSVIIWDAHSGNVIHQFREHTQDITAVAVLPSQRFVASSSLDGTVRIWNAPPPVD